MPWTSEHTKWLVDTGERLETADGKEVEVWEFRQENDEEVLSAWAKHFRNHYCLDTDIDFLWGKRPRPDYLTNIKFPCRTAKLGPVCVARNGYSDSSGWITVSPAKRPGGFVILHDVCFYIRDQMLDRMKYSSADALPAEHGKLNLDLIEP